MRENTGRQIITTVNFTDVPGYGLGVCSAEWTPEELQHADVIDSYADAHRKNASDPEYLDEYGQAEVFEYELAGLRVVALMVDGKVSTAWSVEDADIARLHTAARTSRVLRVRYAKPAEGGTEVTRRDVEVQRVWTSKAGHVMVTAYDRRRDDTRNFRADRITHTTLHRATTPVRPAKAALAAAFQAHVTVAAPVPAFPAPRAALEESVSWSLYDTHPDTPAALEAPESVQDTLAEAFALGQRYVKVYA